VAAGSPVARADPAEGRFLRDLGARSLVAGVVVPGGEALRDRYLQLNQEYQLAQQAILAGDRGRRAEAARLAGELQKVYGAFGQLLLESELPCPSRAEWEQLSGAQQQTNEQVEERRKQWAEAPAATRRQVWIGLGGVAVLLLAAVVLLGRGLLPGASQKPASLPPVVSTGTEGTVTTPPTTSARPLASREAMTELFPKLAPAVPLVQTGDGTGSGFLVEHQRRYLVITNRHVIENAARGVTVEFLYDQDGKETRYKVPATKTEVIAIHQTADLAVIDVSSEKAALDKLGIKPLALAPREHRPKVGEEVFAIGHPVGVNGEILTQTLTKGSVSGLGRLAGKARYLQVTVALNPGNSGGPLFDLDGRVVGVNTLKIQGVGKEVNLEQLNFSLETDYVHEILGSKSKSLSKEEIARIVKPLTWPPEVEAALTARVKEYETRGFKPCNGAAEDCLRVYRVPAADSLAVRFPFPVKMGKEYVVAAATPDGARVMLGVGSMDEKRKVTVLDLDESGKPNPIVTFRVLGEGVHLLAFGNRSDGEATVFVMAFEK
jgi:S1-C subfamily serine protease